MLAVKPLMVYVPAAVTMAATVASPNVLPAVYAVASVGKPVGAEPAFLIIK